MPLRRLVVSTALMASVVFLTFAALVISGRLPVWPAVVACLVVVGLHALLLRAFLDGLTRIRTGVEEILVEPERAVPVVRSSSPAVNDLWLAIMRLTRAWRHRIRGLEIELAGSNAVLAALPDPLILVNERREVVRQNAAAQALFGDHVLRRDLAVALRQPTLLAAVDAVVAGGGGRLVEFELTSPVERHMTARIDPLPARTEDGVILLVSLHDLTSAKRAEQMRADFVANASHELRTPLSTLVGFIETLQGPASDDEEARVKFLAIMQQQASRMARLIEDLLSLSRIEMNEHQPPTTPIAVVAVLRHVGQTLEMKAAARGMPIEYDIADEQAQVVADADELAQLFQNLIDNAIKYARPDTAITIGVGPSRRFKDGLAIKVRDRGEGIPRTHLPRLTERFYRVDTARSREMGGTGLGLAIVKHIISRHRGLLEVDSEMGEGTTFTVHLRGSMPGAAALPPPAPKSDENRVIG
ncbi:MAG TPA: ATP-binding protein [Aliidongia sp.]|uniref:ATP-binding protein n=1 Tax=Aliidongia sp. TaxID=1914230 RepID=UPI002DDD92F9|nr:ATP-binding protein [Aliidongia sp.]HEV2673721.1 ATP-binding protein [Aliidongia sp.]